MAIKNRRRSDTEMPALAEFFRAGKTRLFTYLAALAVEIWAIILAEWQNRSRELRECDARGRSRRIPGRRLADSRIRVPRQRQRVGRSLGHANGSVHRVSGIGTDTMDVQLELDIVYNMMALAFFGPTRVTDGLHERPVQLWPRPVCWPPLPPTPP